MIQRTLHVVFVLIGFLFLFLKENSDNAMIYFGLALAFDPFEPTQKWQERPIYQKAILYIEVAIVLFLLVRLISKSFN
uniref:hypothetical protein n=1 Tax=Flavobacterium sp. TaxID=239 RepID=UPI00404B59F0